MKKSILIVATILVVVCIAAYGFMDRGNSEKKKLASLEKIETTIEEQVSVITTVPEIIETGIFVDFIYEIGPRFNAIKKSDLSAARSFRDFIGDEHADRIVTYESLRVIIMENDEHSEEKATGNNGNEGVFTSEQLEFLAAMDYSTNIKIWADYVEKNKETGVPENNHWTPHLTVVPEKQAQYPGGMEALMKFLKKSSKEVIANVNADKLKPAKLYFTVTRDGTISNVKLDRSSNYPDVDEKMMELITKTPGQWQPAENVDGEKVDQEQVISFGLKGC